MYHEMFCCIYVFIPVRIFLANGLQSKRGATVIPGAMFVPESRVVRTIHYIEAVITISDHIVQCL